MPGQFLTAAERRRWSRFPEQIAPEDLIAHFTLTPADQTLLAPLRGDPNRLGSALQLCALRFLGFCPDELTAAPAAAVGYLAHQLNLPTTALREYGERAQTRTEHLRQIQAHLGFREADPQDLERLAAWLLERALEHDKPTLLLQLAAERLLAERIVRPGITRVERLVATARQQAQEETARRLAPLLDDTRKTCLDELLQADEVNPRRAAAMVWLRQGAAANSPRAILAAIAKRDFLIRLGVEKWDLSPLTPNRRKFLAQLGRRYTPQALERLDPERRYPILLAFLQQTFIDITDEIIDLFDRCLAQTYARARHDLEEWHKETTKTTQAKLRLFQELSRRVLDAEIPDAHLRSAIYQRIPREQLEAANRECERLCRPLDDNYFDLLAQRYPYLRQFAPKLLDALPFRSQQKDDPLLAALALLQRLNTQGRHKIPEDEAAELAFVPAKWHAFVVGKDARINRHYFELCALWQLRAGLRAGDLWIEGSRRYANPDSYLLPPSRWPALRTEMCRQLRAHEDGAQQLAERRTSLEKQTRRLKEALERGGSVRLEDRGLVVTPLPAEDLPPTAKALSQQITDRLPQLELAALLIEVDGWTGFSHHLEHAAGGGRETRTPELLALLYAAILSQACNLPLSKMAQIGELSYRRLAWCTNWYLREETLRPAIAALVNFQQRQPLSRSWGSGTLSSSDGQRFPAAVKMANATALPRYFGYGRGLTFYTWTADQFSQYGAKVIPATVRDATYVLDEILDNETELPLLEHTTDTNGYTEIVFALFDLLGLQFSPRIRDLADQRLYRLAGVDVPARLAPLFSGVIQERLILKRWDDLLRVAASLKRGWVTASLLISKLQAFPRQNGLARALQEYGRLVKTLFILRYLESEEYRRRINTQLTKGEALHALRRFLFFGGEGQIRRNQPEDQANQASCLNLVTNAVVVWNTVYMEAVLAQLRGEGGAVAPEDLAHLSPARCEHINPYGRYTFHLAEEFTLTQLRPLRCPQDELEHGP